ncbi:hypothetical protein [Pseudomonas violetae]|uniref:Uncharacterized protein n=1 Tax=Pseudomonas violetae TaxID=2915813 RepID=A0ABT0F447_9PSED|nr:hypothetical protein [Pseudomonas violetae]MCK1792767.1 hypothetical protein [Pseudomonas violetae]
MTPQWHRIDDGTLLIAGQPVPLPHPVKEALRHKDRLLILVEPPPDVIFNRNVFALSMHGELLWQIEESPHGTEVDKPYVNLHCDKNEWVIASNWNGLSYSVDLHNGAVSVAAFEK